MKAGQKSVKVPNRCAGLAALKHAITWFIITFIAFSIFVATDFAFDHSSIKWWPDVFAIVTNLLTGGLVSFFFYYLVVFLPEGRKKSIIKANMQKMYKNIKIDILQEIVQASIKGGRSDLECDLDFIESLTSPLVFRQAFEHGEEANEGFYAFENQMSDATSEFKQIVKNLTVLSKQIEFILHNYSIENQNAFDFFKRLEILLMNIQTIGAGYDESKPLCRFIWEIYAGWSFVDGSIGYDPIEKMISNL